MSHIDAYTKGGKPVVAMRITVTGGHHPGCQAVTEKGSDSDGVMAGQVSTYGDVEGSIMARGRKLTWEGVCQGDVDIQGGDNTLTKFRCLTTASVKE